MRNFLFGFYRFLFTRWQGKSFVELARANYLFRVGLPLLFDEILLSGLSPVGLSQFLLERREEKRFVQLAWLIVLFPVVLAQLFVGVGLLGAARWTCVFFVCGGRKNVVLNSRG